MFGFQDRSGGGGGGGGGGAGGGGRVGEGADGSGIKVRRHPYVVKWKHGGKRCYLTGSFNGWASRIPLVRSGEGFSTILDLPPGRHEVKFMVDDQYLLSPELNQVEDTFGNSSNVITVEEHSDSMFDGEPSPKDEHWCQKAPPQEFYRKQPPLLPPHLEDLDAVATAAEAEVAKEAEADVVRLPLVQYDEDEAADTEGRFTHTYTF